MRTAALVVLAVAVPLLVVAWIAGIGFGRTETDRADVRLQTEGRAAAAVFFRSVTDADRRAGSLAGSPELQQALATRDRAAVEKLVRPGEVVYAGNSALRRTADRRPQFTAASGQRSTARRSVP